MKVRYIIALVVLGTIGGGWWYAMHQKTANTKTPTPSTKEAARFNADTDGDGLKDWQELLVGFDPKKVDSDGDGIDDATAYRRLQEESDVATTTKLLSASSSNVTDTLGRRLFAAYFLAKQQNRFEPQAFHRIVGAITDEVLREKLSVPQPITEADIRTTAATRETAAQYRTALTKALAPTRSLKEYELTIYARALAEKKEEDFAALRNAAAAYRAATRALQTIPVPDDIVQTHLELTNGFAGIADALAHLKDMEQDPIYDYARVREFVAAEQAVTRASEKLRIYFTIRYRLPYNQSL